MSAIDLLHDTGQPIIVSVARPKEPGQTSRAWNSFEFKDRRRALAYLAKKNKEGLDAYIKHGLFDGAKDDKNRPITKIDHVIGSRTFVIEIDARTAHKKAPYATPNDAMMAFINTHRAMKKLKLPQPNILQRTGGGVLAAWVTDEVIIQREWAELQHVLHHLFRQYGLDHDAGIKPIDKAIRCCGPEFKNYNHGEPLETEIVRLLPNRISADTMRTVLKPHLSLTVITNPMVEEPEDDDDEYAIHSRTEFKFDLNEVRNDCEIIKEALATGGEYAGRVEWTNTMAVAARHHDKVEGMQLAHEMSYKHPEYTAEETAKNVLSYGDGKKMVLCKTFQASGFHAKKLCDTCAFKGKVNSLGGIPKIKRTERVASLPALPDPQYYNGAYGVMQKGATLEDKDTLVLGRYHITEVLGYDEKVEGSNEDKSYLTFKIHTINGTWHRNIKLDTSKLCDVRTMKPALSACGLILSDAPAHGRKVHEMFKSWIESLREQGQLQQVHDNLGWSADGKCFVLGATVYMPGPNATIIPPQNRVNFGPRGDRNLWYQAAKLIMTNETRPEAHALAATAFGAPLMQLVGMSGIGLNFYSSASGRGKTTLSRLAASVWGQPTELGMGVDDTVNAVTSRLAELGSLPAYFDEVRAQNPEEYIRAILYRLASGQGKRRLGADAKEQATKRWDTNIVFTTNLSFDFLHNSKNHGDATQSRYFEFEIGALPLGSQGNVASVDQLKDVFHRNYGFVGADYADYIVKNKAALTAKLTDLAERLLRVTAVDATDTSGRIQAAVGACLVIGANIVQRKGWMPLDATLVLDAVMRALKTSKADRKLAQVKLNPNEVLHDFTTVKQAHRVITKTIDKKKHLADGHPYAQRPICFEIDTWTKQVIIDQEQFREFLNSTGHNARSVFKELQAQGYNTVMQPIAAGTTFRTARRAMFVIDIAGSVFEGMELG